jgi:hypothetical protein
MPNVHVCTLLPYAISTPHFDTAANHTGLGPHPVPPVQTPEKVARALVDLAESPRRERHVPRIAYLGLLLHELLPRPVERTLLHVLANFHVGPDRMSDHIGTLRDGGNGQAAIQGHRAQRLNSLDLARWVLSRFVKIMTQPAPAAGR